MFEIFRFLTKAQNDKRVRRHCKLLLKAAYYDGQALKFSV